MPAQVLGTRTRVAATDFKDIFCTSGTSITSCTSGPSAKPSFRALGPFILFGPFGLFGLRTYYLSESLPMSLTTHCDHSRTPMPTPLLGSRLSRLQSTSTSYPFCSLSFPTVTLFNPTQQFFEKTPSLPDQYPSWH